MGSATSSWGRLLYASACCAMIPAVPMSSPAPTLPLIYRVDGTAANDRFGTSVSIAGDVDGDGVPDFVVGAPASRVSFFFGAGSAYVFSGANGGLIYRKNGPALGFGLGRSVSGAGDVDSDGFDDFIAGASGADPDGLTDAGSAFVYSGADGSVIHRIDGATSGDLLGLSVSGAGDVDGDGLSDFIIGATFADPGGRSRRRQRVCPLRRRRPTHPPGGR